MPRRKKPPRLWRRRNGTWIILDSGRQESTRTDDENAAREYFSDYLIRSRRERRGPSAPHEITCGEIIESYYEARRGAVAAADSLRHAVRALAPFWADLTADAVKRSVCARYVAERSASPGTARRELGVLQAAMNYAHQEGALIHPLSVTLPSAGPARDRWLTRDEAARLLRASPPHLRRFILISLYTGRRTGAVLALRWMPSLDSGHVDLKRGWIDFAGRRAETAKRRGRVPMPRQLAAHMRRWSRTSPGAAHVVEFRGAPMLSIKTAWRAAILRSGIEDAHPHDLKRTAVTWAFQRGMSREDASGWFDTTAATLESVYRQHSPDFQRRALDILERRE